MNKVIFVVGPTAIGKTSLSITLAENLKTEIISADSRQFYKEMKIGTAVPDDEDLLKIKHHFIRFISIHDSYSVYQYEKDALKKCDELLKIYSTTIVCGGSGLYVKALSDGLDELPPSDKEVRKKVENIYLTKGINELKEILKQIDYKYYCEVDLSNPARLMRAIEVYYTTGQPFSSFRKKQFKPRNFIPLKIGLFTEKETLYKNISDRVDLMIKKGLVDEAKNLYEYKNLIPLKTFGYKELFDYFDNKINFEKAIELIKQNTKKYAKKQMTWFRKDRDIKWFDVTRSRQEILEYIKKELGL